MKRYLWIFAGVLVLAGSVGTASAADLPRPAAPTKPPAMMPFSWTGLYVGFNAGGGWGTSTWDGLPSSFSTRGALVGGQVGYNWQVAQFVWGLEGDVDWSSVESSGFTGCNTGLNGCDPSTGTASCTIGGVAGTCGTSNDFLATIRGRVGFAVDRWMPFATGGAAFGNIRTTGPISQPNAAGAVGFVGDDIAKVGWTVGGGIEFALPVNNWTAKVEYLYVNLGSASVCSGCGNATFIENVVRGGINYRF
jgi:outer membrane immunogenic protein